MARIRAKGIKEVRKGTNVGRQSRKQPLLKYRYKEKNGEIL